MTMRNDAVVVSVVGDAAIYDKCIESNPCMRDCRRVALPADGRPKAAIYNAFLDTLAQGDDFWIVICNEDWRIEERVAKYSAGMRKDRLYGPYGTALRRKLFGGEYLFKGGVVNRCARDCSRTLQLIGEKGVCRVDELDEQCIFVHSSLILKHNLRFDESLDWPQCTGAFCREAFSRHGIRSYSYDMICTSFPSSPDSFTL